jgi:hypothetical protein
MLAFLQANGDQATFCYLKTIHATMHQRGRIPASLMCASSIMYNSPAHTRVSKKGKCKCLFRDMCSVKCSLLLVCDPWQQSLHVIEPRSICHICPWQNHKSLHGHSFHLQTAGLFSVPVQYPILHRKMMHNGMHASKDAHHLYPGVYVYRHVGC